MESRIILAISQGNLGYLKKEVLKRVSAKHNGVTPLLLAIRTSQCEIVQYLVDECGANVEQTASVEFDGDEIHHAPPLWCAAAVGCIDCVRFLVKKGASVNSTTSTNSTPLRAACFDGHFEIVKYLVEAGADMEIANQHGHTCLMISCYKKHLNIATYLLDRGAQINRQSAKGNTAMHDAAESNHMEILKLLVRNGAKFLRDCYNMTPLMTAALTGNREMVQYLKNVFKCSTEEEADAYKLLGATYVDKFNDLTAAYGFWRTALEKASANGGCGQEYQSRLLAPSPATSEAYGEGAKEIANEDDLSELYCDSEKMKMQSLMIRERILGISHPETFYFIRFRGAAYADRGDYDRAIKMWIYNLERQQATFKPFSDMTHSLYLMILEIFNLMYKWEEASLVNSYDVFRVLKLAIAELLHPQNDFLFHGSGLKKGQKGENGSSNGASTTSRTFCTRLARKLPALRCSDGNEGTGNGTTGCALNTFNGYGNIVDRHFLLIIQLIGLLVRLRPQMSPKEWRSFQRFLYEFVALEARSATSYTLLHVLTLISQADMPATGVPIAPLSEVFEVLVNVSRHLDIIDLAGNTPLHLLFRQIQQLQNNNHQFSLVANNVGSLLHLRRSMVQSLLARGAHLDLVNEEGKSPLDYVAEAGVANKFKVDFLSLQCRAAAVVVKHNLPLDGLSAEARSFVAMHTRRGFSANVYDLDSVQN